MNRRPALSILALVLLAGALASVGPSQAADRENAGGVQWGTAGFDGVTALAQHGSALYVSAQGAVTPDITSVSRHRPNGARVWTRELPFFTSITAITADATGLYVTGHTQADLTPTPGAGGFDAYVRKYSPAGAVLWTVQFGTSLFDISQSIAVADGRLYLAGRTAGAMTPAPNAGGQDYWVRAYSLATRQVLWTTQDGGALEDSAEDLVTLGGNVYASGTTYSTLPGEVSAGTHDAFLVQLAGTDGAVGWRRQYGTAAGDGSFALATDGTRLYAGGQTEGTFAGQVSAGHFDAYLRVYSTSGAAVWTRQFGTPERDVLTDLAWDRDAVVAAGVTDGSLGPTPAGGKDMFVRRYAPGGQVVGGTVQRGTAEAEEATAVASGRHGLYVGGWTEGSLAGPSAGAGDAVLLRWVTHRPDALAKKQRRVFAGNDRYGTGQRVSTRLRRGKSVRFVVRAQNDGEATERLRIRGCRSPQGLTITFHRGRRNVTRAAGSGRLLTPVLENAGTYDLTVKVKAGRTAKLVKRGCSITVANTQGRVLRDQIKVITRITR